MKIAFICRHYNKTGGISRHVAEIAERFAKNNEVHVFTASWQDVGNPEVVFHKIPILTFGFLKKWKKYAWNNVFEVGSFMLNSSSRINYHNFDIVHSQGDYIGEFDIYTAHSCHRAWLDIIRNRELNLIEKAKKSYFNPLHLLVLQIEEHSVKRAKKIISVSLAVKREIVKYYHIPEEKISVIPNGVDIEKFNPENKKIFRKKIRDKHDIKEEDIVLIFPAHEFKRKGLFQIIEAFKILKKDNLHLLVIGRDDPAPFFKLVCNSGLKNKIIFTGEITGIEMYYAASDILIFPTSYEPFGLVILEAMASGIPVIVSQEAGAAELIRDEINGIVLKNNEDSEKLVKEIRFIVNNSKKFKEIGEEARKTAENYSWDNIASKTFSLYEEILKEKRR